VGQARENGELVRHIQNSPSSTGRFGQRSHERERPFDAGPCRSLLLGDEAAGATVLHIALLDRRRGELQAVLAGNGLHVQKVVLDRQFQQPVRR